MLVLHRLAVIVFLSGTVYWFLGLEPIFQQYRTGSIPVLILFLSVAFLAVGVSGIFRLRRYFRRQRAYRIISRIKPHEYK
jgi:hypothetical protein